MHGPLRRLLTYIVNIRMITFLIWPLSFLNEHDSFHDPDACICQH